MIFLVSASFQFVGFLLTYLLHTSHAAKVTILQNDPTWMTNDYCYYSKDQGLVSGLLWYNLDSIFAVVSSIKGHRIHNY